MKHLVLIGGGHSHALVLRMLGKSLLKQAKITLISDVEFAPYSGMLPGFVAGIYNFDQCHINLPPLAAAAGVELIIDRVVKLDLNNKTVATLTGKKVEFDLLSINTGCTPDMSSVTGAAEYSTAVKPIAKFVSSWQAFLANGARSPVAIVGGGTGGAELALAVVAKLESLASKSQLNTAIEIHLIHAENELLGNHNSRVRNLVTAELKRHKVQLHLGQAVTEVRAGKLILASGVSIDAENIFWTTQAKAPDWPKESGLAVNSRGFIEVDYSLRSTSHSFVFAAGDVASLKSENLPKAGVFAVRQAKPLFSNLCQQIEGKNSNELQHYIPQKTFLSLISTSRGEAICSWGSIALQSRLFWFLKDFIDLRFMRSLQTL